MMMMMAECQYRDCGKPTTDTYELLGWPNTYWHICPQCVLLVIANLAAQTRRQHKGGTNEFRK